eukprot:CAMPEP_0172908558 /NCGR_PEP_ID=MMETSP1075-20121228/180964_1 /TAXON_ID=2916 /ORGANISM="Ceratium fusus, Strain PA161109" /LENGTH=328 /DNA_ID=CAMNT_0013766353 /DNA_START=12 /DNA_END=995 /DNA_ORIENTATION=+
MAVASGLAAFSLGTLYGSWCLAKVSTLMSEFLALITNPFAAKARKTLTTEEAAVAVSIDSRFACSDIGPFSQEFVAEARNLYAKHLRNPRICYVPRDAIPASMREEVSQLFMAATGKQAYIVNMSFNMIIPGRRIKFKLHYDVDCWAYEDNYQIVCMLDAFDRPQNNVLCFSSDGEQINPLPHLRPGEAILMNPELYHCTAPGNYCRISLAIKITTTPVVTLRTELVGFPFVRHMPDFVGLLHYRTIVGQVGRERAFEEAMELNNRLYTLDFDSRPFRLARWMALVSYLQAFGVVSLLRIMRQLSAPSSIHVARQQKAVQLLSKYVVP